MTRTSPSASLTAGSFLGFISKASKLGGEFRSSRLTPAPATDCDCWRPQLSGKAAGWTWPSRLSCGLAKRSLPCRSQVLLPASKAICDDLPTFAKAEHQDQNRHVACAAAAREPVCGL